MKVLVNTCNKSQHLLPGFAYCFNKFWPIENQEVIILGYDKEEMSLPNNFTYQSLGHQDDYGRYYTDALIPYFKEFKDESFISMLDDYYLTSHMDYSILKHSMDILDRNSDVVKVDLTGSERIFHEKFQDSNICFKSSPNALYRSSLQASIWKTWFFKEFLIPNRTIWDFEIQGTYQAINRPNKENEIILGLYYNSYCRYWNASLRGNIDYKCFKRNVSLSFYKELKDKNMLPRGFDNEKYNIV